MFTIDAKARGTTLAEDRTNGELPAVFYGAGKTSTPITVSLKDFLKIWKEAGESTAITLKSGGESLDVMIHDVQIDPVRGTPLHADFLVIDATKAIRVSVPLEFTGLSAMVKGGLGSLVKVMHELEIEALPKELPHSIIVDTSALETLHSQILVESLPIPKGVTVISKGSDVVAAIAEMKEEVEEVAAPVDLSAIEVEKKGKKEEEGAAPAEEEKK